MKVYFSLILGLVFLLSISLFFNYPGVPTFVQFKDLHYDLLSIQTSAQLQSTILEIIFRYTPGLSAIFTLLLQIFPPDKNIYFFYHQHAWVAAKLILLFSYLITPLSIIYFIKSFKKSTSLKKLEIAFVYFLSFALMLSNLALGFFDLLTAPLLILSFTFLHQRRYLLFGALYLICILFNWTLLILAPLFVCFIFRGRKHIVSYVFILLFGLMAYINSYYLDQTFLAHKNSQILNVPYLLNSFLSYLSQYSFLSPLKIISISLSFGLVIYTLSSSFIHFIKGKGTFILASALISISIFVAVYINASLAISLPFLAVYLLLTKRFFNLKNINLESLCSYASSIYASFLLFLPFVSAGNLSWLVIFSLLIFSLQKKPNVLNLLLTNIVVFILLFINYGTNSLGPDVKQEYLNIFRFFFSSLFVIFSLRITKSATYTKYLLIVLIVLFFLSLVPSQGTSDVSVFDGFNRTAILNSNPFYNHSLIDNQYPPLSTVIYTASTHLYQNIVGFRELKIEVVSEFGLVTKITTAAFYFISMAFILLFVRLMGVKKSFFKTDLLLVFLTTFSLGFQSASLTSTDILTIPAITLAIILLFKRQYLLGGLFLGMAATIKWQPVALFPLFILTAFDLRGKLIQSISRSLQLLIGLLLVPTVSWALVLTQPGGEVSFEIGVIKFLIESPPLLSGLAMNLNWIATYYLHITQPSIFGSPEASNWMNWQIGSSTAPPIFRGYLFYLFSVIILLKYWLFSKKDLPNFLSAAVMVYFSHYMFNKGAHHNHSFYFVFMMLLLYLIIPTWKHRLMLILFDLMNFLNQSFFYGTTGSGSALNRVFLKIDVTVIFAIYYLSIYGVVFREYLKSSGVFFQKIVIKLLPINKSAVTFILITLLFAFSFWKINSAKLNSHTLLASAININGNFSKTPYYLIDNFLAGINIGNYERATQDFTPTLITKINREEFDRIKSTRQKTGALINLENPKIIEEQGLIKLKFNARFSQDRNGKLEAIFIKNEFGKYKIADLIIDSSKLR